MKNIKTLLLLCLPALLLTGCDYTYSKVNPSSIDSVDSKAESTSEVDPYLIDAEIWKKHFETFDNFYIDKNYTFSVHVTGKMDEEEDDFNVQIETADYVMRRVYWETGEEARKEDPTKYSYLVSSKAKTHEIDFEVDEVYYDEDSEGFVSEDSYRISKLDVIADTIVPMADFRKFEYNEETHFYQLKDETDYVVDYAETLIQIKEACFKFESGKVVEGKLRLITDGDKKDYTYEYKFDFDHTAFKVPQYTVL